MTIFETINQAMKQSQQTEGKERWRVLIDLSKAVLAELGTGYDIAEVRKDTKLGYFIEMARQGKPFGENEAKQLADSIIKEFWPAEFAKMQYTAKMQAQAPKQRDEFVIEDNVIKFVKWEKYGKSRIYLKNDSVSEKKADLGFIENGKWVQPKNFDNIRFALRNETEWDNVINHANSMLK